MKNNDSIRKVAIIPARGGSKRIPSKNIKIFAGQPIIAYSIQAAIDSNLFDRIILSTDSREIAEVGKSYGAEVPFMRPSELADDFTGTAEVLLHSLDWLIEHDIPYLYFCCIYPTAPFLQKEYLIKGFQILSENNATIAFSVAQFSYPIFRALKIESDGRIKMIWPEYSRSRSNDLATGYHCAGQFYWGNAEKFLEEKELFSSDSFPVILPRHLVHDIDMPEDWEIAEQFYNALKNQ